MSTRRLEVVITGDSSSLQRAFGRVESDAGRLERGIRKTGKAIGVGLGVGAVAAVPLLFKAQGAASDLAEQVSKSDAVFGESAKEIRAWSETTAQGLGISQRQALEATGTFGNMLVPMGLSRDRAGEMSQRMVTLAADMASFNNASPEETLEALRSGLAGESEPLRKFGVFLSDARLKQEALSMGLYDGKGALDANAKAQATYALILKDSKDAQGDFARTSEGVANSQRIARAQLEDTAATLGTALIPITQKTLAVVNDLLVWAQANWPRFREATARAFEGAREAARRTMAWFESNVLPTIQAIVGAARSFWARFGNDITAAFNLARRIVERNMQAVRAAVELVLAVIRGDWSAAWRALQTIVRSSVGNVVDIVSTLPGILGRIALTAGRAILSGIVSGLKGLASRITTAVVSAVSSMAGAALAAGESIGRAIASGIVSGVGNIGSRIRSLIPSASSLVPNLGGLLPNINEGGGVAPLSGGLRRVAPGTATDLTRTRSGGDRAASGARRNAEAAARGGGATADQIRDAGEKAYINSRLSTIGTLRGKMKTRHRLLVAAVNKALKNRAKVKVPRRGPGRQKALDRRAALTEAINNFRDEIETLVSEDADLVVEAAELGAELEAIDRGAEGGDASASAGDVATDPGPTAGDALDAAAAQALLTEGLDDDVAAAEAIELAAHHEYNAALASGDPRRIAETARALAAARQNTEQLRATRDNTDALNANTEAQKQSFAGSVSFGYRGQGYVLGTLGLPSSDRLTGMELLV